MLYPQEQAGDLFMLEKFRTAKKLEISNLAMLEQNGAMPPPITTARPGFASALLSQKEIAVIAEYKRASPSRGAINMKLEPAEAALDYARGGASALSVLTENHYFQGHIKHLFEMCGQSFAGGLSHDLPILRKDFIFSPLQVKMSAATPASAILLIVRMLKGQELNLLMAQARTYGLECVVEVFNKTDLKRAQDAEAKLIQVNNRDLSSLQVDLKRSLDLAQYKRSDEVWISASGIEAPSHLKMLTKAGYNAVLVGSALMAEASLGEALKKLRGQDA